MIWKIPNYPTRRNEFGKPCSKVDKSALENMPESENFIEQIGPYVISEIEYRTISIIFENRKTQQKKKNPARRTTHSPQESSTKVKFNPTNDCARRETKRTCLKWRQNRQPDRQFLFSAQSFSQT